METGVPSDEALVAAFAALAHPQRLALLRLLMRVHPQRLKAGEIGAALDLRPSTLSGYLAQMAEAGLIEARRQGTALLYAARPETAAALSGAWLGALSGGRSWPRGGQAGGPGGRRVRNLLFLGAGNGGPSLLAEALLRAAAGERYEVFSAAAAAPGTPDPALIAALEAEGLDTGALWSKPLSLWQGAEAPPMDVIVTLGARAARAEVVVPGLHHRTAWSLAPLLPLERLRADLGARIERLAALGLEDLPPQDYQAGLEALAVS